MRRKLLVLAIGLTGCATAHKESFSGRPDGGMTIGDSNNQNMVDAPMLPDSPTGGGTQTLTQTTTFAPADTTTAVPQHIDIAADITGNLVVEIDQKTAGSTATPYMFYIGANSAGEMVPGYISTPDCTDAGGNAYTTPTSMSSLAGSAADMVLTVTGST